MNYLFFDIECCDGHHICSFGYVVTNENFEILKKEDIVINPQWRFRKGRDGFDPEKDLAYTKEYFMKQPAFPYFYSKLKRLLVDSNYILLGHGITSDISFLDNACKRYDFPKFDLQVYDTQNMYYQFNKLQKQRALEDIIKDLVIDISLLHEHKSCDDAEVSMLITRELCKKLQVSLDELLELCDNSIRDNSLKNKSPRGIQRAVGRGLRELAEKYPQRFEWESICLSDSIQVSDVEKRLEFIKQVLDKGYNYIFKASEANYFVMGSEYGKRDECCDYNINENGKNIKKITIEELSKMLKVKLDECCNIVTEKDDGDFAEALKKQLLKRGLSYEEFIKNIK